MRSAPTTGWLVGELNSLQQQDELIAGVPLAGFTPEELLFFYVKIIVAMPNRRILIVDDQRDIRQLLRASLESLTPAVQIVDVPSGEEALLVITRQKFDLLVSDVRLAGMSGLELVGKVRKRNPSLKVILITGLTDSEVRQQVAEFGAEAFFYKPVDIIEFRARVADCLGLEHAESEQPAGKQVELAEGQAPLALELPGLAEYAAKMRESIGASCVWIIDRQGEILSQAGDLPEQWHLPAWKAGILAVGIAAAGLTGATPIQSAGGEKPGGYLYLDGQEVELHLLNLSGSRALLATTPVAADLRTYRMEQLLLARRQIEQILADEIMADGLEEPGVLAADAEGEEIVDESELVELGAALQQAMGERIDTQQANDFWDALTEGPGEGSTPANSSLSYEQARKLGLAPED